MPVIINDEQAKNYLASQLGVASFVQLPAELREAMENFEIANEADFLKLLSYLHARSQSKKSGFSDLHKKIDKIIFDYCSERYPDSIKDPFNPQQALYFCRKRLASVPEDVKHLGSMDYSRGNVAYKNRFQFWLGYQAANSRVMRDKKCKRFNKIADRVYLGMMPNVKLGGKIIDTFKEISPGPYAVVSTLQDYELFGDGAPQLEHANFFWHNQDVHHFVLPLLDNTIEFEGKHIDDPRYSDEDAEKIMQILEQLRQIYLQNGSLYFHCKAGQGRSSAIAILFLSLFEVSLQVRKSNGELDIEQTIENVHSHVCGVRKQVDQSNPYRLKGLKKLMEFWLSRHDTQPAPIAQDNGDHDDDDNDNDNDNDHSKKAYKSATHSPR